MKNFTLRLSLLSCMMLFAGMLFAQWQVNYTVTQNPQKMYPYSSDTAFIVGNTNTLYRTNDKGATWASVTVPTSTGNLMDIAFLNKTDGFIVNASGLIYYSSDKGTIWSSLSLSGFSDGLGSSVTDPTLGTSLKFNTIACSQNVIYTVLKWTEALPSTTVHSYLFKSTDKGVTWTKLGSDLLGVTTNSIEVIGQTIYICGSSGTFKKSIDGGANWTDYSNSTVYTSVNDIRVIDANTVLLSTTKGLFKTTDGGTSVNQLTVNKGSFDALYFADQGVTFTCGAYANILRSTNNGTSWEAANRNLGATLNVFDLTLFNNTIFAMGGDKKIYTLSSPSQLLDPTVDFTIKYNDLNVEFTNTSTNSGSYSWDFDFISNPGISTSTEVNPIHAYAGLGEYSVKLISGNAVSQANVTKIVTIAQSSDYSYLVGSARQVTFTNLSQNYSSYTWDFGDLGTSTDKNPLHTYTSYGDFTVKLTVSDGVNSIDVTKTVTVPQPTTNFSFVVENGNKVTFTNLSQNASTYTWDFGDATPTSNETNPIHTYTSVGTFDVKLIASDGATSPELIQQVTTKKPTPLFSFTVGANKTVTFTNLSVEGVSYIWDFGDGTAASTETNPTHIFASFNTYSVKLIATNSLGSNEVIMPVGVLESIANFNFVMEGGDKAIFTNTSINCTNYSWDFGDGTALSTEVNPSHTYASLGDFNVKLVAGDGVNESIVTKIVTIVQPSADFSFVVNNGNEVTFTNLSQNYATCSWDFGDGTALSTNISPVHSYSTYGKFNVKLIAGNSINQVNTTKEVTISQPIADFSYTVEDGNKIVFTNLSLNCLTYSWDFSGFGNSIVENPSFVFPMLGSFDVKLTGNSNVGPVSVTKTISVDLIGVPWSIMSTGVSQNLQKMFAFNNDTAIIVGNSTTIIRSNDGGRSWASATFPPANAGFTPNDIFFFDKANGLVSFSVSGSNNGFILKTADNGQNWSQIDLAAFSDGSGNAAVDPKAPTASKVYFYAMTKNSSTTGFVVLRWFENTTINHGYVYKTTDKGLSWTRISSDIYQTNTYASVINAIGFDASGTTGYIAGVNLLLKTTDGGVSWNKITLSNIASYGSINDLIVRDANTVYLATQNGTIKTTDGFTTGSILDASFSFDIINIDENSYLSGKDANTLKVSRDNGATWELSGAGIGSFFELAVFNNKVYALAAAGKVYISYLDFYNKPVLDFSYALNNLAATFTNLSTNAKSYEWTFGDNQSSVEFSPIHTYSGIGTYSITLNGGNLCWKGAPKTVSISISTIDVDTKELDRFQIWPNPATEGFVNFSLGDAFKGITTVNITDIQGRLVYTQKIDSNRRIEINLNPGMYLVRVINNNVSATQKLIIK